MAYTPPRMSPGQARAGHLPPGNQPPGQVPYDENGNTTGRQGPEGAVAYRYDGENRLIEARFADGTWVKYAYDGFGRRVYREEAYWQNRNQLKTEITHYLWDGLHVLMEFDGKGVSPLAEYYLANGQILAKKIFGFHGRKEPGNEDLIRTRGGLLYYLYDRLGTVVALTDRQGELVTRYYYDIFGEPLAGTFGPYNSYGLTGKEYDEKLGHYYFGARWLYPNIGRWISRDPYRGKLGKPASLGRYIYVSNNPIKYFDPFGYTEGHAKLGGSVILGVIEVEVTLIIAASDFPDVHLQLQIGAGPAVGGGFSFTGGAGASNAQKVDDTSGFGVSYGASGGEIVVMGTDYYRSKSPTGEVKGGEFSIGVGVGTPGEVHRLTTYTIDLLSIDIPKLGKENGAITYDDPWTAKYSNKQGRCQH